MYLLRIQSFSKALMWKHWRTDVDTALYQDGANKLLSTTAMSLRLSTLLLLLFVPCLWCLCMCWIIQKNTIWDSSRLRVFATHLSIMSRAMTALGIEMHLKTEWAIKSAPAGVLVPMLESARRCSTQRYRAWLLWKPILLKRIFIMEGIWLYEHLLMTLLWQSQTDGAAERRKDGKGGKVPERKAWWRLNQRKWERACGWGRQCRRYEW